MTGATYVRAITALVAGSVSWGCTQYKTVPGSQNTAYSSFDVNRYPVNKLVCDPFGGTPPVGYDSGLKAKLFYLPTGVARQHNVSAMIANSTASSNDLFFTSINVPTRLFSAGFPTQTGGLVKTDDGQTLTEYFALRFEGALRLGEGDGAGTYEFALLSDDGAIMSVGTGGEGAMQVLVNNDGDHPTRMGCGGTLEMNRDSRIPIKIDYYQGPRYHISVIPLWRKVEGARLTEAQCGKLGNEMYFDYNNASNPQAAYLGLIMRGWKPIGPANYVIPSTAPHNPCVEGQAPIVTEVNIAVVNESQARVTWTTDIPSTSQVLYTRVSDGVQTLTTADNTLVTNHSVVIPKPSFGQAFDVQAVSISDTLGKTISPAIRLY